MTAIDLGNLGMLGTTLAGPGDYGQLGRAVSAAGDINGDGLGDFMVSLAAANAGADRGGAFVLFGRTGGLASVDLADLAPEDGFFIQGPDRTSLVSQTLAAAGDVNDDGYADILVGVPAAGDNGGRTFLLFGGADGFGPIDLDALAPDDGFLLFDSQTGEESGVSLSSAGDINNDGFDDFVIGTSANRAFVIFGKAAGFGAIQLDTLGAANGFTITADGIGGLAGNEVSAAGDFNGDGFDDFVVGAPGVEQA